MLLSMRTEAGKKYDDSGAIFHEIIVALFLLLILFTGAFKLDFSLREQFTLREAVRTAARAAAMTRPNFSNQVAQEAFRRSLENDGITNVSQFTQHIIYTALTANTYKVEVLASSPNTVLGNGYCVRASFSWEANGAIFSPPASITQVDSLCF